MGAYPTGSGSGSSFMFQPRIDATLPAGGDDFFSESRRQYINMIISAYAMPVLYGFAFTRCAYRNRFCREISTGCPSWWNIVLHVIRAMGSISEGSMKTSLTAFFFNRALVSHPPPPPTPHHVRSATPTPAPRTTADERVYCNPGSRARRTAGGDARGVRTASMKGQRALERRASRSVARGELRGASRFLILHAFFDYLT